MNTKNSKIDVLTFGQLVDITGHDTWQEELVDDIDELKFMLIKKYPELAQSKYLIAVNMEITRGNSKLNQGDVVALLPPFSGG